MSAATAPLKVVAICSANECRSPAFARLLERDAGAAVTIRSAGTASHDGRPLHPLTIAALLPYDVRMSDHRSRSLLDDDLDAGELLLVAARAHRSIVVRRRPRMMRRIFTMLEFARIVDDPQFRVLSEERGWIEAAARLRTPSTRRPVSEDVEDPVGLGWSDHVRIVSLLAQAARTVASALPLTESPTPADGSERPR